MKRANRLLIFLMLLLAAVSPAHAQTQAELRDMPSITVLVPEAISTPMAALARAYSKKSGVSVVLVVESPGTQAESVKDGDEADVMVVDDTGWFKELQNLGLLDIYSQRRIFSDPLVVMASDRLAQAIPIASTLPEPEETGQTPLPAQGIGGASLWQGAEPENRTVKNAFKVADDARRVQVMRDNIQTRNWLMHRPIALVAGSQDEMVDVTRNCLRGLYVPHEASGKGMIAYESTLALMQALNHAGQDMVGVGTANLYQQFRQSGQMKGYHMLPLNPALCEPVEYHAAVVAGQNMQAGRDLIAFLSSEAAAPILSDYGLKP
ncbi:hypothetical protein GC177_07485 [bacterium]|nr:hypothetical protein [bacterium]